MLAIVLLVLFAGCELLGMDAPDLRVETERDEFVVGQDTSFSVTLENAGDQSLYYNSCLDVPLEKLRSRRVVEVEHSPACECLCVTELAPGESATFGLAALLAGAALPQRAPAAALFRLRFALYSDSEMRNPLPDAALRSNRFRVRAALRAWTDAGRLLLENHLDRPLAYIALEEQESYLVDLAGPSHWPHLAAGEQVAIPYDSLMGYDPGDERAVVYWSDEDERSGSLWIDLD